MGGSQCHRPPHHALEGAEDDADRIKRQRALPPSQGPGGLAASGPHTAGPRPRLPPQEELLNHRGPGAGVGFSRPAYAQQAKHGTLGSYQSPTPGHKRGRQQPEAAPASDGDGGWDRVSARPMCAVLHGILGITVQNSSGKGREERRTLPVDLTGLQA